jgi:O-methyltransferase involved in polyketide biosynthesis
MAPRRSRRLIDALSLSPVERTAFLTLYARALDCRCSHPILNDDRADSVVGKISYDFEALRIPPSVRCPVALRTKLLDERVRRFVDDHPDAVVVDLGAGLDHAIWRTCPPPTVDWYSIDLPAVIELRDAVLPAHPQEHHVAARIGDRGWADTIPANRPAMLVADGLTGFLNQSEILDMFRTISDHFRTGELAFNDYGRVGWISRTAMKLAPQGAVKAFGPNWRNSGFADARSPQMWNPRLTLVEEASLADAAEIELFPLPLRLGFRLAGHVRPLARRARILRYRF